MPKIIFKCRYLKDGTHAANLVEYMATREGVEKLPANIRALPSTAKQRRLIGDLLAQFPDTADLLEYEDYQKQPTIENASEFITAALEQNMDPLGRKDVYVQYIATRPRVEKSGTHGLFSDAEAPPVLSEVAEEVSRHTGNVWTPIISLRREDAARLGYDHAAAWMALLRKQRNLFSEQMKISPENLRWYAAFHDEGHHPHCHMIVYSVDPREGYVTKPAINEMRSTLAHEIFQQDLMQIYPDQTARRNELAEQSRVALSEIIGQMESGVYENKVIEDMLSRLSERLKYTSGRKQYGYLKAELKTLVDQIVDELSKDARVAEAYRAWYKLHNEILHTYADKLPDPLPLSQQKEFKHIKNIVIEEALRIGERQIMFEGDEGIEAQAETAADQTDPVYEPEDEPDDESPEDGNFPNSTSEGPEPIESPPATPHPYIEWSDRYKQAREFLYGKDDMEPDLAQALRLFQEEADAGNALAMHDLGRMYADGLGIEADAGISFTWYEKALTAFYEIEMGKSHRYVEYRIGKMHAAGHGIDQDYEEAAGWFEESASENYKYAQYSLAGLYYRGQGVELNYNTAFALYQKAARQHFPYASYELAKMYRDGIGTAKDHDAAAACFREAFLGFQQLEAQSRDDKLQYRLGQMLYTGTGTERDIGTAVQYLEKSAKLGNAYAQCLLGNIYLAVESSHADPERGIFWLNKAVDAENDSAEYLLGKLYRDGLHVERNMEKAVSLFTAAADQKNPYAAYALGKLYLEGTAVAKDVGAAVRWLTISADLGNSYAQYALAKLYLSGEDVQKDVPHAVDLFTKAALKDNSFAQYRLGKLYLQGDEVPKDVDAAVRWLTASAERDNQYAQYLLGKLYLMGQDVPRDREAAVRWLTASAGQGNPYAQFFLDHLDSFRDFSPMLAATRLLHHLSRIFREQQNRLYGGPGMGTDSKLRRRLRQKKMAMGHAPDEQTPEQTY
ncbi:hypothetical protein A7X67_16245 [Clostridium sp. W14A]|nr:hypothetical protein A7X67_16245 [Clostridium sp. W14A]